MDKFNVITPTNDLEKLDQDMLQWSYLPYDFKMRSNDECIRRYNCTVTDLYNRIKSNILQNIDSNTDMDSNIVRESVNFEEDEFFLIKLKKSRDLQTSPYIIIIDPDIKSKSDLAEKYNSFNLLNEKYKRLSNDYSWQIWGYNVYNMYSIMLSKFETDEVKQDNTDSNLIIGDIANFESCVEATVDVINHAKLYNDTITCEKFLSNIQDIPVSVNESLGRKIIESYYDDMFDESVDVSMFPKVTPWFTPREMNDNNYIFNMNGDNYYKSLIEAYKKMVEDKEKYLKEVLCLGWNPEVKPTLDAIEFARTRQCNEARNFELHDIHSIEMSNNKLDTPDNIDIKPIFFIFGNDRVSISFSSILDILYEFKGINNQFDGFKKLYKEDIINNPDYNTIEILCVFVNNDAYKSIESNITSENISGGDMFNSIYSVLINRKNVFDPDVKKLIYANYIDMLLKITCIDSKSGEYNDPHYIISKHLKVFKVFSGDYNSYDYTRIENILNIICSNANLATYVESLNLNETVIDKLIATSSIYSLNN